MIKKESILKALELLPDELSVEEVIDCIMLIQKVENGIEQSQKREVLSDNEAKIRLGKWLG